MTVKDLIQPIVHRIPWARQFRAFSSPPLKVTAYPSFEAAMAGCLGGGITTPNSRT